MRWEIRIEWKCVFIDILSAFGFIWYAAAYIDTICFLKQVTFAWEIQITGHLRLDRLTSNFEQCAVVIRPVHGKNDKYCSLIEFWRIDSKAIHECWWYWSMNASSCKYWPQSRTPRLRCSPLIIRDSNTFAGAVVRIALILLDSCQSYDRLRITTMT